MVTSIYFQNRPAEYTPRPHNSPGAEFGFLFGSPIYHSSWGYSYYINTPTEEQIKAVITANPATYQINTSC